MCQYGNRAVHEFENAGADFAAPATDSVTPCLKCGSTAPMRLHSAGKTVPTDCIENSDKRQMILPWTFQEEACHPKYDARLGSPFRILRSRPDLADAPALRRVDQCPVRLYSKTKMRPSVSSAMKSG